VGEGQGGVERELARLLGQCSEGRGAAGRVQVGHGQWLAWLGASVRLFGGWPVEIMSKGEVL